MKHPLIPALALCALCACTSTQNSEQGADYPTWLESDSVQAIHQRMLNDFSLTFEEGAEQIIADHPELTIEDIREFANKHYIEVKEIDGQLRMHRKSVKNLNLLNPDYNGGWKYRGWNASDARISYADSIIKWTKGKLADGGAHAVKIRFSIDVPYDSILEGDTLRVWMPYPIESARQSDIKLISTSQPDVIISTPEQSAHRTIYFEAPVGKTNHFEYVVELTTSGEYHSPEDILANMKPYDKASVDYKKFTAFDNRHIVRMDSLAKQIVGDETNPYKCSELVYDYIIRKFPWAGAREYSTIPCIPQYVMEEGHGDCGQVALLYISIMRTLGIPARWESGWMLHPDELNFHDWAEVYFEGTGWVPVDVSFGRYTSSPDAAIQKFYSTGIDSYRFATNTGVGDRFYPTKRYIRSETVDSQAGEVECSKGNLFYPAWTHNFEIISSTPINK